MPLLTQTQGPIDFRYETAAPTVAGVRGSIAIRIDAGNVGLLQNVDGTLAGWTPVILAGGAIAFTTAATWTLLDNSATALVIGATGATSMLTFDTTNGAEAVAVGARLTTTDGVSSGTARVVGGRADVDTAESASLNGAEALFAANAGQYTVPANTGKANTEIFGRILIRVESVSGGPTAQVRVRLGGLAGTLVFDTTARTVADEDLIILEFFLWTRSTGAGGTLTGYCRYWIGAADALSSAAGTEVSIDVAGSAAGTWTAAFNTTIANDLVVTGQTDGAGTNLRLEAWRIGVNG